MKLSAKELVERLQETSRDTPYVIEKTDKGFTLHLNVVDKKWYTLLQKNRINRTFRIEATLDEVAHTATTTDVLNALDWSAGGVRPRIGASISTQRGEIYRKEFKKELGVSEDGEVGVAVDYSYDTAEAKNWLETQLQKYGWKRKWGIEAKLGLAMGLIAVIGIIVCGIIALILWLTGAFN